MILKIIFLLCAALPLQLVAALHGHGLPHYDHLEHILRKHQTRQLKMSNQFSHSPGRHVDPGDTLSSADIVKFLLKDTSTKIADLWKDIKNELDLDRQHNMEVNKHIVQGLGKRIDILEKHLMSSLSNESPTNSPASTPIRPTFSCNLCDHRCLDLSSLDEHVETTHPSLLCEECGKTLRSKPDLNLHRHRQHNQTMENPSETSQTIADYNFDKDSPSQTCGSLDDPRLPSTGLQECASLAHSCQVLENTLADHPQYLEQPDPASYNLPCDFCAKVFNNTDDLKFHLLEHYSPSSNTLLDYHKSPQSMTSCNMYHQDVETATSGPLCEHGNLYCTFGCNTQNMNEVLGTHHNTQHGAELVPLYPLYHSLPIYSQDLYTWYPHQQPSSTPNLVLHCSYCDYTSCYMVDLNIHMKQYHPVIEEQSTTTEARCDFSSIPQSNPTDHTQNEHVNPPTSSCGKYDHEFLSENALVRHLTYQHSPSNKTINIETCNECDELSQDTRDSTNHPISEQIQFQGLYASSDGNLAQPVHCKLCDKTFLSLRELNIHTHKDHRSVLPTETSPIKSCEEHIIQMDGNDTIEMSDE